MAYWKELHSSASSTYSSTQTPNSIQQKEEVYKNNIHLQGGKHTVLYLCSSELLLLQLSWYFHFQTKIPPQCQENIYYTRSTPLLTPTFKHLLMFRIQKGAETLQYRAQITANLCCFVLPWQVLKTTAESWL